MNKEYILKLTKEQAMYMRFLVELVDQGKHCPLKDDELDDLLSQIEVFPIWVYDVTGCVFAKDCAGPVHKESNS